MPQSTAKGYKKLNRVLSEGKENNRIIINEPATNLAIQHTITNRGRKQQQHCCCCNNSSIATHTAAAAAAAAAPAPLRMHIKRTSQLFTRHVNHHRTYFYTGIKIHGANTRRENDTRQKGHHPCEIGMYLHVRTDAWKFWRKNENRTRCRETTRARPRSPVAESRETSKVRPCSQHTELRTSSRARAITA